MEATAHEAHAFSEYNIIQQTKVILPPHTRVELCHRILQQSKL